MAGGRAHRLPMAGGRAHSAPRGGPTVLMPFLPRLRNPGGGGSPGPRALGSGPVEFSPGCRAREDEDPEAGAAGAVVRPGGGST